jgi:hypothetical protein
MIILVASRMSLCNTDCVMTNYELLGEVRTLANNLMRRHNLAGWHFKFNDNRRRLGVCRYYERSIELSTYHVASGNWGEITNTILHEIAHALVGAGHGHGIVWKRKAIEIGCNGERCGHMDAPSKYLVECPSCKHTIKRNRLSKRRFSCSHCSAGGRFDERFELVWKRVS